MFLQRVHHVLQPADDIVLDGHGHRAGVGVAEALFDPDHVLLDHVEHLGEGHGRAVVVQQAERPVGLVDDFALVAG